MNVQTKQQFGYLRDELLGQQVTSIIPEGFSARLIADGTRTATEALAPQMGTGIELVARRKDGGEFPIEIMLSPLGLGLYFCRVATEAQGGGIWLEDPPEANLLAARQPRAAGEMQEDREGLGASCARRAATAKRSPRGR